MIVSRKNMKILSFYDITGLKFSDSHGILDGGRHGKCGRRLHFYNDMLICEQCNEVIDAEFNIERTYDPVTRGEIGK